MRACSKSSRHVVLALVVVTAPIHLFAADRADQAPAAQAIVGTWWQSAWKLCKPVPQMEPDDVDPPIESLEFKADGTFSVTWRGGGTHTGDIPHVFIPDYTGRYTIDAAAGRIRMQIVNGLFVPNDFAGNGAYAISGNTLTFTGVWFGTRQAKHRPDICELTFTKR